MSERRSTGNRDRRPLPNALDHFDVIVERLGSAPGVFTDYDGTLTPIVDDPADALLPDATWNVLRQLTQQCLVAVISGRDLRDLRRLVGLDEIVYAGSHGFEISGPGGLYVEQPDAVALLPLLDEVQADLESGASGLGGTFIERKRFAVAVHTRRARSDLERRRAGELARSMVRGGLELQVGKEIFELRPATWDKGRTVAYLVQMFEEVEVPLYIGDDTTDEDAFRLLRGTEGIGIRVDEPDIATAARYRLEDPDRVREFLARLSDRLPPQSRER